MIFVTGDTHSDFARFSTKRFIRQKELSREDFVIVCGDFGIWDNSKAENRALDWLNAKPFTTLFIDGNHENFDLLNGYPTEEKFSGTVHRIRENIFHLMRGQAYMIDKKLIFTMGGAKSHDISDGILKKDDPNLKMKLKRFTRQGKRYFRVEGVSWWESEMPSGEEYLRALNTVKRHGGKFDIIITHCAPSGVIDVMGEYKHDELTDFLESIRKSCEFKKWYFAHYHNGRDNLNPEVISVSGEEKFIRLYEQIAEL